ncbi:MAG: 5-(carboxyamino)imidazole ribonucleotide mutase, partial [Anaerolineales bacterium]|nr:5-(carboxyamino)imidazole ribonucleotide mutase [Anaerolineales bacterium]
MANVAILMGSESDRSVMKATEDVLDQMGVDYETHVISAHRNPEQLMKYVTSADDKGIKVFIAGAGGAAALPGAIASWTSLPVIGVPVASSELKGI